MYACICVHALCMLPEDRRALELALKVGTDQAEL